VEKYWLQTTKYIKVARNGQIWAQNYNFCPNVVKCRRLSTRKITTTKYSKNQDGLPSPNDTGMTGRTQRRMKTEVLSFHPALHSPSWNPYPQFSLPKRSGRKHPYYILATTKSKDYKLFWKYMKFISRSDWSPLLCEKLTIIPRNGQFQRKYVNIPTQLEKWRSCDFSQCNLHCEKSCDFTSFRDPLTARI